MLGARSRSHCGPVSGFPTDRAVREQPRGAAATLDFAIAARDDSFALPLARGRPCGRRSTAQGGPSRGRPLAAPALVSRAARPHTSPGSRPATGSPRSSSCASSPRSCTPTSAISPRASRRVEQAPPRARRGGGRIAARRRRARKGTVRARARGNKRSGGARARVAGARPAERRDARQRPAGDAGPEDCTIRRRAHACSGSTPRALARQGDASGARTLARDALALLDYADDRPARARRRVAPWSTVRSVAAASRSPASSSAAATSAASARHRLSSAPGETESEAHRCMDAAWEAGITAFDTADAYGGGRSESFIGSWMRSRGVRPALTTKTFNPMSEGADRGLAPDRIRRQFETSLERLGVDRVDVYLAHAMDPDTPVVETAAAFAELAARRRNPRLGRQQRRRRLDRGRATGRRPELLLAARTRRRSRGPRPVRARGDRLHAVQPARGRLADGQVPARRGAAAGLADDAPAGALPSPAGGSRLRRARGIRASARVRAGPRRPRSRSPGSSPTRA